MKLFLATLLVGWIGGALYLLSATKAQYCGASEMIISPSALASDKPLISFEFDRYNPDTSAYFHILRDSLIGALGANKQLRIIGRMSDIEATRDSLLGIKRANATRTLFKGYLDMQEIDVISTKASVSQSSLPLFEVITKDPDVAVSIPMESSKEITEEPKSSNNTKTTITTPTETADVPSTSDNVTIDNDALYVIYFKDNSSEIISPSEVNKYLSELEQRLKQSKEKIVLVGYDDDSRSSEESMALAKRRTWRIRKTFKDNYVRRKLVSTQNIGKDDQSKDNSKSRRVEIRIIQ